jgi:hypothetical protein
MILTSFDVQLNSVYILLSNFACIQTFSLVECPSKVLGEFFFGPEMDLLN